MTIYDVIIVGGGPIGLACGIEAKEAGMEYLIIEKGCLVNSLYHYPLNMTFFSTSERLKLERYPSFHISLNQTVSKRWSITAGYAGHGISGFTSTRRLTPS